ncbi:hypothetical protein ACWDO0_00785 [Nocardia rhamnosiphila]|uniref:hypothetical protein n=1 Tax=Nocardia rhamnosiphila TaxID=426716 RepID=UPI0004C3EB23|nr:hypothetical protein [Nocardia rhamnosiphila]
MEISTGRSAGEGDVDDLEECAEKKEQRCGDRGGGGWMPAAKSADDVSPSHGGDSAGFADAL